MRLGEWERSSAPRLPRRLDKAQMPGQQRKRQLVKVNNLPRSKTVGEKSHMFTKVSSTIPSSAEEEKCARDITIIDCSYWGPCTQQTGLTSTAKLRHCWTGRGHRRLNCTANWFLALVWNKGELERAEKRECMLTF